MAATREIKNAQVEAEPKPDRVQDGAIGAGIGAALGTMVAVVAAGPFGVILPILGAGVGSPLAFYGLKAWREHSADEVRKKAKQR